MEAKLIKTKTGFYLWRNPLDKSQEILGATVPIMNDNGVDLREHKLSLKNCQAIENGYDLDELRQKAYEKYDKDDLSLDEQIQRSGGFLVGFEDGFQKAIKILGDKKFSEEDMKKAIYIAWEGGELASTHIIESLQQTEWDVEIVMECCGKVYSQYCDGTCEHVKPLLDVDGCLILKRK